MIKNITLTLILSIFISYTTTAQVGIGTTTPEGALDITTANAGLLIPRGSLASLTDTTTFTNPQGGGPITSTLIYNNGAGGVNVAGFYYWDGAAWVMLTTRPSTDWTIVGNTGTNPTINFIGTVDDNDVSFRRQSVEKMRLNTTETSFMDKVQIRDGAANSGDVLVELTNSNDDGIVNIYQDNAVNHQISGNNTTIFNELGSDLDLRIESNNNENVMFVDAGNDAVIFGSTGALFADGNAFNTTTLAAADAYTTTIDYVADFDNGLSRGTTMGLGSIEFLVDGEAELYISDTFSPTQHLTYDLGFANEWRNIYAGNIFTTSDINAKKNIKPMTYGLDEIMQLSTISYELKDDPFQENRIGLVAQEVNKLVKEASKTETYKKKEDGTFESVKLKNIKVSYISLVPVLIKATQEQQEQIKTLENRVNEQQKIIDAFEARLQKLEKK